MLRSTACRRGDPSLISPIREIKLASYVRTVRTGLLFLLLRRDVDRAITRYPDRGCELKQLGDPLLLLLGAHPSEILVEMD